jgi:hypothetical protein
VFGGGLVPDVMVDVFRLADRVEEGQKAEPVGGDDEEKDGGDHGEEAAAVLFAGDVFDLADEEADDRLEEVLEAAGHYLHGASAEERDDDEDRHDDPGGNHGVGDVEESDFGDDLSGDDDLRLGTLSNKQSGANDPHRDQRAGENVRQSHIVPFGGSLAEPPQELLEHAETANKRDGQSEQDAQHCKDWPLARQIVEPETPEKADGDRGGNEPTDPRDGEGIAYPSAHGRLLRRPGLRPGASYGDCDELRKRPETSVAPICAGRNRKDRALL